MAALHPQFICRRRATEGVAWTRHIRPAADPRNEPPGALNTLHDNILHRPTTLATFQVQALLLDLSTALFLPWLQFVPLAPEF